MAFGGFAMNTISVNGITNRVKTGTQSAYEKLNNGVCSLRDTLSGPIIEDIRKALLSRPEFQLGSGCDLYYAYSTSCNLDQIPMMYAVIDTVYGPRLPISAGVVENKINNMYGMIFGKILEWLTIDLVFQMGNDLIGLREKIIGLSSSVVTLVSNYYTTRPLFRMFSRYDNTYSNATDQAIEVISDLYVSAISSVDITYKNSTSYKNLCNAIRDLGIPTLLSDDLKTLDYFRTSVMDSCTHQLLFDLYYSEGNYLKVKNLIASYNQIDVKRTWLYGFYPEDRKRSRIYFDGYNGEKYASGAFKVNDPIDQGITSDSPEFDAAVANYLNGTGSNIYDAGFGSVLIKYKNSSIVDTLWHGPPVYKRYANLNDYFPIRSLVVPHKFTRGTESQVTLAAAFPRVYSVVKYYSSSGDELLTLFWAHIPLYPGCGYPTMNYDITDKYGKPDFMNNNYQDNIFIFYLVGNTWRQEILDNGVQPICEEDFYIESVYHGRAQLLRAIDSSSKRLNPGNYVTMAEDGIKATIAPSDPRSADILGGSMGNFRIYVDNNGFFVYKRKISTNVDAKEYTVYSDYITVNGMADCASFTCWTPFREDNGTQSAFKSILVESVTYRDTIESTDAAPIPTSSGAPSYSPPPASKLSVTDDYKNILLKKEAIISYAAFKHPCNPTRTNPTVIRNVNVLRSEGWRIVNVGGDGWVDPKATSLNHYKIVPTGITNDKWVAPNIIKDGFEIKKQEDLYGGMVGTMMSKWGLPTQEKYITKGEWIQLNLGEPTSMQIYQIRVPSKFVDPIVSQNSMISEKRLPRNRSPSDWTLLGSNDEKTWVLIDLMKNVDFSQYAFETSALGNFYFLAQQTLTCYLKEKMSFQYVRLVINGLHENNVENIFSLAYFGVSDEGFYYYPTKGVEYQTPRTCSIKTSISPYGFDNNFVYSDSLQRSIAPLVVAEQYNMTDPYNNQYLGPPTGGSAGLGNVSYYNNSTQSSYTTNASSNLYIHNMDHPWAYRKKLANAPYQKLMWSRDKPVVNTGIQNNPSQLDPAIEIQKYFDYTDDLDESSSPAHYVNISLGKYMFNWAELKLFIDTKTYSEGKSSSGNPANFDIFVHFGNYIYSKITRDKAWSKNYGMSYDRKRDKFYQGSTITTYVLPCSVGDPAPSNCSSYYDTDPPSRPPPVGYNNMRPDQEVADSRFVWPQPYQGGSYLVSPSANCVSGMTCNSTGGNKENVTPSYCFWIGDAATYQKLMEKNFPVQRDFNMNIMFDGDTNIYNDVPLQCLGKLSLDNLDVTTDMRSYYPPPALYRTKGWRLFNYPQGRTLIDGSKVLKNAMASANGEVVFTFPDVATALSYAEYDTDTQEDFKTYTGCQGPPLLGTNVSISCGGGKIKSVIAPGDDDKKNSTHIKWGKWEKTACRDSFGDTEVPTYTMELPSKCIGQKTCTINEADFGWLTPLAAGADSNATINGVTHLHAYSTTASFEGDLMAIADIKVWTSKDTYVRPDWIVGIPPNDIDIQNVMDGNPNTYWEGSFNTYYGQLAIKMQWNNPISIYKIDLTSRPGYETRASGIKFFAYGNPFVELWRSSNTIRQDGGADAFYEAQKPGYRYYSWWPGIDRSVYCSNDRPAYNYEYPIINFPYNADSNIALTNAKTISLTFDTDDYLTGSRYMNVGEVKIYSSPTTRITNFSVDASSVYTGGTPAQTFSISRMTDGVDNSYWQSGGTINGRHSFNPGVMITLNGSTPIHHIIIANRQDSNTSRMTGMAVTIRNAEGRVIYKSQPCPDKNPSITSYSDTANTGYLYYGFFPAITPKVIGSDRSNIETPLSVNLYQKHQWEVVYSCDYSSPPNVFEIPSGQTFAQLHENYRNLMMHTHRQTEGSVINPEKVFPQTMNWYGEEVKMELYSSPEFKAEVRKAQKEHYRENRGKREHYWDGDICKPIGKVFEVAANGILDGIYNPIVNNVNKIGILRRNLGLKPKNVTVNWSCPIPGLGEAIAWICNAALAVGQAFVDAYNFVCKVGEAVVSAVINTGKWLVGQLQERFTLQRTKKFLTAFNNGMTCGFSSIGSAIKNSFSWIADGINGLVDCVTNFGSAVGTFFMDPNFENFVAVVSSFLAIGATTFLFVLDIGLSLLEVVADVIGAVISFIVDAANWVYQSVVSPIVNAISDAASAFWSWLTG
jgi:hypothetical protein